MADIINLRRARKHKARTEKDVAAQANRILHSTPKALRETAEARKDQATDRLDGKKLDTPSE
jgi:hypothetical protein